MSQLHDPSLAGHFGAEETKQRVAQQHYKFGLKEDVSLFIQSCDVCQAYKEPLKKLKAPLGHLRSGAL